MGDLAVEDLGATPSVRALMLKGALTGRGRSGSTLPERTLRHSNVGVDRDHLTRYQRLCGWDVADQLPPTYPHVLGFPLQVALMTGAGFPFPILGLVHVENAITVHRPLFADDRLSVSVRAEALRDHRRGRLVDLVTEVDIDGTTAWAGRSTYLNRGAPHPDAPRGEAAPAFPQGTPSARWRLPAGLGREYGSVSGDLNPIHLHALTARPLGYPRAIAHGMWSYARTLAALGPRSRRPSTSHVWFRKPVLLPSTVELVIHREDHQVVAGLRAAKDNAIEHLVLRLTGTPDQDP